MSILKHRKNAPSTSGNKASILLLLIPIVELAVVFIDGGHFPINQPRFLTFAALATSVTFVLLWWYSFRTCSIDRNLILAGVFLFLLWSIGGIPFIAWSNETFDASPTHQETHHIVRTHRHGGGVRSRAVCTVWLDNRIADIDVLTIRADYCDIISPGTDGLDAQIRAGALGFPWLADFAIIKNMNDFRPPP